MGSVIDLPNRSVDVLSKDYEKCGEITKRELEEPKQVNAIQDRVGMSPAFQSQANSNEDFPELKVEVEEDLWKQDMIQDQTKNQGSDFIQGFSQSTFDSSTRLVNDPQAHSGKPTVKIEVGSVLDMPRSINELTDVSENCDTIIKQE